MTEFPKCPLQPFCKHDKQCSPQSGAYVSIMSRYSNTDVPNDYKEVFMDNSVARKDQENAYRILDKYVESFKGDGKDKSVYLFSRSPGTGKTTTAIALLHEYIRIKYLKYVKAKKSVPELIGMFLDLNDIQRRYNMASMSKNEEEMKRITEHLEETMKVDMLVLDDVGVRSATESFRAIVHGLINYRVTNGLPTIYTSNNSMEDMKVVFDERLYDRIKDQTLEITFVGTSKRGMR